MHFILPIIFILLLLVFFQDQKYRAIWWFLPPLIFVSGLILSYPVYCWTELFSSALFILSLIGFLFVYIYIRFKDLNLFRKYFGIGDLLFLICITPYFEFKQFVFFFTLATLISLLIYGFVSLFKKQQSIPYAGYLALVFGIYLCLKELFYISIFNSLYV